MFSLGSPFDFVRDRQSLSFFFYFVSSLNVVYKCLCVTAIYTWHTLKNNSVVVATRWRHFFGWGGGFKINILKREILILYFNGPIESVDDDNEKDDFFPLFAHESDSSRGTSSQTKRRRRDIFLLGRHHQFTRRKSFVWKTTVGPVFGSSLSLFFSLLSLFFIIISRRCCWCTHNQS